MRTSMRFLIIVFCLALSLAGPALAYTPDRGLINPLALAQIGNVRLAYGSFDPAAGRVLVSYAEYDQYAKGHGAVIYETGGSAGRKALSFIGTKELGALGLGLAVERVSAPSKEWLLDLGASLGSDGPIEGRVAVHEVPFTKWSDFQTRSHLSVGATLHLKEFLSIGVDAEPAAQQYTGFVTLGSPEDLAVRLDVMYGKKEVQAAGADIWLNSQSALIHLGYTWKKAEADRMCLGFGFKY